MTYAIFPVIITLLINLLPKESTILISLKFDPGLISVEKNISTFESTGAALALSTGLVLITANEFVPVVKLKT